MIDEVIASVGSGTVLGGSSGTLLGLPLPTDIMVDGEIYPVKRFGNQIWMSYPIYRTPNMDIPLSPGVIDPMPTPINGPARCYWNNAPESAMEYPVFFNWYAGKYMADNNFLPYGWHIPSIADFTKLIENAAGASGSSNWKYGIETLMNTNGFYNRWTGLVLAATPDTVDANYYTFLDNTENSFRIRFLTSTQYDSSRWYVEEWSKIAQTGGGWRWSRNWTSTDPSSAGWPDIAGKNALAILILVRNLNV